VQDRTRFEVHNLFHADIAEATVLALYLFQRVNLELRPRIFRELKPGTRVVSHEFDFGNWRPDEQRTVEGPDKPYGPPRSTVYLWIVPADASGRWVWHMPQRAGAYEVTLQQTFQQVMPVVPSNADYRMEEARLRGDRISFVLVSDGRRERYDGRINGDTISGTVTAGSQTRPWAATRTERGRMDIEAGRSRPQNHAKESR
jgi:hypothetical protein